MSFHARVNNLSCFRSCSTITRSRLRKRRNYLTKYVGTSCVYAIPELNWKVTSGKKNAVLRYLFGGRSDYKSSDSWYYYNALDNPQCRRIHPWHSCRNKMDLRRNIMMCESEKQLTLSETFPRRKHVFWNSVTVVFVFAAVEHDSSPEWIHVVEEKICQRIDTLSVVNRTLSFHSALNFQTC